MCVYASVNAGAQACFICFSNTIIPQHNQNLEQSFYMGGYSILISVWYWPQNAAANRASRHPAIQYMRGPYMHGH